MRSIRNRLPAALAAAILLFSLCAVPAMASDAPPRGMTAEEAAWALHDAGLLHGAGTLEDGSPDFRLDGSMTRGEAVTMVARFFAGDEAVLSGAWEHPFADAGWADAYIGWAYANGVASGVSATEFGTDLGIGQAQFVTLMLRGLGREYADWRNPYPCADLAGLYCPDDDGTFTRGDAALILLSALDISEDPDGGLPYAAGVSDVIDLVGKASACRLDEIRIRVPDGQAAAYAEEVTASIVDPKAGGYADFAGFGIYAVSSGEAVARMSYADDARIMRYLSGMDDSLSERDAATYAAAKAVHDSLVSPGMSEYRRVEAFHDWIVGNCEYDFTDSESRRDAYGVFVGKSAVCDGYVRAMNLLCWLDGIGCVRVTGWAVDSNEPSNQGRHAWNKIRVDGAWYNLDACWDDPVGSAPRIDHGYFLKSDAVFGEEHFWDPYPFWPDSPSSWAA